MIQIPVQRLLLVPLALWATHVAVSFTLVEAHCRHGVIDGRFADISAIRLLLLSVTAAALLALGANAFAGARAWSALRGGDRDETGVRFQILLICAVASSVALLYLSWAVIFATGAPLCR